MTIWLPPPICNYMTRGFRPKTVTKIGRRRGGGIYNTPATEGNHSWRKILPISTNFPYLSTNRGGGIELTVLQQPQIISRR